LICLVASATQCCTTRCDEELVYHHITQLIICVLMLKMLKMMLDQILMV